MVEPRPAAPTVKFVDEYCQLYQNLFPEVRSFEAFKYLHMGCVSDIKRKTLPEIAKIVGLDNHQALHHFLTESPWDVQELRRQRLELILYILQGRPIILIIDETGDKKKGNTTDYVKRQYIGNLGKTDNGIVAVTAYAVLSGMTFPLIFEVYKPRERLQPGEKYLTKPEIAGAMIRKLRSMGFRFNLVLADSLYGESGKNFLSVLNELELNFIVAIRSNHRAWGITDSKIKYSNWQRFRRVFSDLSSENRYIREIICGKKSEVRYWQITTDIEVLPKNTTWYVMSKYPDITPRDVGNFYGLRTWVEYGLKQSKNELGWADFRLTHYPQIEKWWEIVFSAYLLVSLHSEQLLKLAPQSESIFSSHPWWNQGNGWNNILNNLRLILQPFTLFNLIKPWLAVFTVPKLSEGFFQLQMIINNLTCSIFQNFNIPYFYFSSA
ncbi:IS701 family transposase [Nostoc sp. UHCC 0252]|uniref:IS701 family transposase n=1 Tax=Nostoc sp. UHCC 0252 TaxID=3110241 RepID=UPI002B1EB6C0|nr:IS701 family transposase [Nostoc sp. UHCC 0252]MEA5606465.1 IS701 family transposase [Nostoc sp. UHCC 0252]